MPSEYLAQTLLLFAKMIVMENKKENQMVNIMHQMDKEMDTMQLTKDIDHDFSAMMIAHHKVAIDIANIIVKEGKDDDLKEMAQIMIDKQKLEIGQFQEFLKSSFPHKPNEARHRQLMEVMENMSSQADQLLLRGNLEKDFVTLMLTHHRSAIDMANIEIGAGNQAAVKELADEIIKDQEAEVEKLKQWLADHKQ